jgi:hypothetical protein
MGRNKLPHRFGSIPLKIWEKLEGKDKQFLFKYDYFIKKTFQIDDEILELEEEIKELKKNKEYFRKRSEDIWVENKHLKEDYSPKYNISKNDKYTNIKNNKFQKEKKFIGRYWLVNVKYKKRNKSIHIGKDEFVKEFLKNNEWVIENKEDLGIKDLNKLSDEEIKLLIDKLISDNLYDIILSTTNFFEEKVRFEDLVE